MHSCRDALWGQAVTTRKLAEKFQRASVRSKTERSRAWAWAFCHREAFCPFHASRHRQAVGYDQSAESDFLKRVCLATMDLYWSCCRPAA